MKPSSSTQAEPCSVRVRTLDGSKDVRGARHEPKGRLGLNVLAAGYPWLCGTDRTHKMCTYVVSKVIRRDPDRGSMGLC